MYGPWKPVPWWVFWRRERYRRAIYAPWNIGGGWDGWEYCDQLPAVNLADRDQ